MDEHKEVVRVRPAASDEQTLPAALRGLSLTQWPSRFYLVLQLAIPSAIQFSLWGWWRASAAMVVLSAFGVWALCEQRLDQSVAGETQMANPSPGRPLRMLHSVSGMIAGLTGAALMIDLVIRFLSIVFKCPGCAG
jgi:hypothetical protein